MKHPKTFKCSICKNTFESGSEIEAIEELNDSFPGFNVSDCDTVCDDCYQQFSEYHNANEILKTISRHNPYSFDCIKSSYKWLGSFDKVLISIGIAISSNIPLAHADLMIKPRATDA